MGRGRRGRTDFADSAYWNNVTYFFYVDRLTEIATSMFTWTGLPEEIDERYLEMTLFQNGQAVFFKDEVVDEYLALSVNNQGNFDFYGNPIYRRAYSRYNSYQHELDLYDSVIIWNNYLRKNSVLGVELFARKLWNMDRTIDINVAVQKTPFLIQCSEKARLTMLNMYKEVFGNQDLIYGDKNFNPDDLKVFKTDAPFIAKDLQELKTQVWNEALTWLGINNVTYQKRERMITDEVQRSQGGVNASRQGRLKARKQACKKINKIFGLDVDVEYNEMVNTSMYGGDEENGEVYNTSQDNL